MKKIFIATAVFVSSFAAQAMPSGTFDCASKDGALTASFEISNYGLMTVQAVSNIVLPGPGDKIKTSETQVIQQWVTISEGYISVALPVLDDQVSRTLVIQTTSGDTGDDYYGTAVIGTQEEDYANPVIYGVPTDVTCVYNP